MRKIDREYLDNLIDRVREYNYFKTIETKDRLIEVEDDVDECMRFHDVGACLAEITNAALRLKPSMSNHQLIEMFRYTDIEAE